mgnify:CR=1 FL=1|jgi:hypothetical protein
MKFGYLIIVNDKQDTDYAKLAYALALSIKNTQKEGYDKVALVINDKTRIENFTSTWVFDEIIEWNGADHWDGRSYMDELTPWEHTICLDADMLFLRDYSHWAEYFIKNSELYIANKAYTYRSEVITGDYYRKCFTANELPNLYSFYTFFVKNSPLVKDFFNLNREIIKNPELYSNNFLGKYKPKIVGTDEAFALAAKILDVSEDISYPLEFPRVVHMKGMIQNWPYAAEDCFDHVGFYFNKKGKLKIGNYEQNDIVHYVNKEKVTLETVNILEEIAWKKNK